MQVHALAAEHAFIHRVLLISFEAQLPVGFLMQHNPAPYPAVAARCFILTGHIHLTPPFYSLLLGNRQQHIDQPRLCHSLVLKCSMQRTGRHAAG
jgi:hypothetical protein